MTLIVDLALSNKGVSARPNAARPGVRRGSVLRDAVWAHHGCYSPCGTPVDPGGVSMISLHVGWRHDQEEAPSPPVFSHLTRRKPGVKKPGVVGSEV